VEPFDDQAIGEIGQGGMCGDLSEKSGIAAPPVATHRDDVTTLGVF
jgi:hypothetical protein